LLHSAARAAENRQLARLHESNVTYWWRRVPDTAYTLVAVVPDVPAPAGGRAAVPHLRRPPRCAAGGVAPGCLAAAEVLRPPPVLIGHAASLTPY
jgi:hypothetical protein